ncbi:MAG: cyclic nucleotide-binding domain-containing protein [Afipia sp.]|nr:cyclic nucleotide-binding domain-containing protein [Afipia sp.]
MSIDDDIALFNRVPTLNVLGMAALNVLAIGAEHKNLEFGDELFKIGDEGDSGFVVKRGSFRVAAVERVNETVVGPGALIGELALMVAQSRPATAMALESSTVIRLSRSLFQRVLESHPDAARRLRDEMAARTGNAAASIARLTAKLT